MYLGIDVGTSSVKAIALNDRDEVLGQASAPLDISRPHPLWSEQDPRAWWRATDTAVSALREQLAGGLEGLVAIGLTGQMHGATLLDASDVPLRPAILWNDGRSAVECDELEQAVLTSREITGNLAMSGFTAPKILWIKKHEPETFSRIARVLLPKDYVRLCMSGDHATDVSDASGTLWLNVAERVWSEPMIEACGLTIDTMPSLYEGTAVTGQLRGAVARDWGCKRVPIVAGAGDNAAGAIGVGVVEPGSAFLSLGTSGVYFVASDRFRPNVQSAVHAFCHALPDTWHQMSVLLSAASCLGWLTKLTGAKSEEALLEETSHRNQPSERLMFLPYLSGERTPHNDPNASGVFVGLDHDTDRADLCRAVLEGVAFAFLDAQQALVESGTKIDSVSVIGGGARSALWGQILASTLDRTLVYRKGAAVGPALGAARLARLADGKQLVGDVCQALPTDFIAEPESNLVSHYGERIATYRELYTALRPTFNRTLDPSQETRA